jgi:membrane-associated phospholipid phosphatase
MPMWNFLKRLWHLRYSQTRFRLVDINCMAYLGLVAVLLLFFHKAVDLWPLFILAHLVLIIGILEMVRLAERHPQKNFFRILRTFYPVPFFLFVWEELGVLVRMIYGSYWATDIIIHWDKLLFGVHPTVWIQKFYQPWLNELMSFFYLGYYTYFVILPLALYLAKKRQYVFAVFSVATFTYFSNFIFAYLLPAVGPQHSPMLQSLQTHQITGYFLTKISQIIQATGGIAGAAFPSSHVSGAMVWAFLAIRYFRKMGYVMLPISLGVAVAAIYLGLHHALDSVFGVMWFAISYPIGLWLIKIRGEDPLNYR